MPYDPSYQVLWRPDRIRTHVADLQPDVLEIQSPYVAALGCLIAARNSFGVRTMMWHSDFIDTYEGVLRAKAPKAARFAEPVTQSLWAWVRKLTSACAATIVASKHQKDKLEAHGGSRIHLLPLGVDKTVFRPSRRDPRLRSQQRDAVAFVAIGRFAVEKRWDIVLDAYRMLRESLPFPHELWVFGDGPEREVLERTAPEGTKFFHFENDRDVLATRLASADILLHACPYETYGLGVAEALASGVCAVLPDQGGAAAWSHLPSVRMVPSLSARALAEAAEALARTPSAERKRWGLVGADQVQSQEEHFDALLALYRELLEGKAR